MAGLGQAVAGVFAYIAAIIDCVLYGECRYKRQHESGIGSTGSTAPINLPGYCSGGIDRKAIARPCLPLVPYWPPVPSPSSGGLGTASSDYLLAPPQPQPPVEAEGFGAVNEFQATLDDLIWLGQRIHPALRSAGFGDADAYLVGSRATGWAYNPDEGKNNPSAEVDILSDWDVAIVDKGFFSYLTKEHNIRTRFPKGSGSHRTEKLYAYDMAEVGVYGMLFDMAAPGRAITISVGLGIQFTGYAKIDYVVYDGEDYFVQKNQLNFQVIPKL